VTLGELAEQIAAWENDTNASAPTSGNVSMLPLSDPSSRRWTTGIVGGKTEGRWFTTVVYRNSYCNQPVLTFRCVWVVGVLNQLTDEQTRFRRLTPNLCA